MTQDARTEMTDQLPRTVVARPIGANAVLTVVGVGSGPRGPWSFVTGIPNADHDIVGPSAHYLSVAAWAA